MKISARFGSIYLEPPNNNSKWLRISHFPESGRLIGGANTYDEVFKSVLVNDAKKIIKIKAGPDDVLNTPKNNIPVFKGDLNFKDTFIVATDKDDVQALEEALQKDERTTDNSNLLSLLNHRFRGLLTFNKIEYSLCNSLERKVPR